MGYFSIEKNRTGNKGKPVDNVGAYIVKYMHKNTLDKRLMGKKAYFTSRNLTRPEVVTEDLSLTDCLKKYELNRDNLVYESNFMSKENGRVYYFEFNKRRKYYINYI
jgi:hypothetical protein